MEIPQYRHLSFERDGKTAWVRLNRPPANAISHEVMEELQAVAEHLESNRQYKVAVFGSANPRFFSAGADLGMVRDKMAGAHRPVPEGMWHQTLERIENLPLPTIAVINGIAYGAGWEFAMVCDLRVMATRNGRVGLPEVKVGLFPAGGGTQRLPRLVGRGIAMKLLLTGASLGAEEALRWGLVSEVSDPENLDKTAREFAKQLEELPRPAMAAIKRCVLRGTDLPLKDGLALELQLLAEVKKTPEAAEGVRAFLEKTKPKFD